MTDKEFDIYLKVKHEFLLEDARYFVIDYLSSMRDCEPELITDNELKKFDFEKMVAKYESMENPDVSFNDTWDIIVREYIDKIQWG